MGLSGRKVKQRIPNDPRNLAWANDANKFGAAYLAKLGWDPSQGLGVSGEGRTTAISVTQKLDLLGIGADHRNSEQGIAWKQNKDFENLLKRLNAANGNGQVEDEGEAMKVDGFVRAGPAAGAETVTSQKEEKDVSESDREEEGDKKSKKKRKKGADDEEGEERKKKRKKSKSSDDQSDAEKDKKKDKKKKKKRDTSEEPTPASTSKAEASSAPAVAAAPAPQATQKSKSLRIHRARHMAAKNMASKSASAIAEILGIAPTPSASVSGSATPSLPALSSATTPYPSTPYEPGPSTSASSSSSGVATPADDALKLQDLTVSSKSVMDYFKEKLAAKSNARSGTSSPAAAPSQQKVDEEMDDYAERPRMGIGASRLRVEVSRTEEADAEEDREQRTGLGGIGSRGGIHSHFAAMFAKSSTTVTNTMDVAGSQAQVQTQTKVEVVEAAVQEDISVEESPKKKSKDRKDKERKEKKEKKEKKDKKGKGKEKEAEERVEDDEAVVAEVDEKAERKRRKEEKRRKREAEAAQEGAGVDASPDVEDKGGKEGKRKKDKKKSKAES